MKVSEVELEIIFWNELAVKRDSSFIPVGAVREVWQFPISHQKNTVKKKDLESSWRSYIRIPSGERRWMIGKVQIHWCLLLNKWGIKWSSNNTWGNSLHFDCWLFTNTQHASCAIAGRAQNVQGLNEYSVWTNRSQCACAGINQWAGRHLTDLKELISLPLCS